MVDKSYICMESAKFPVCQIHFFVDFGVESTRFSRYSRLNISPIINLHTFAMAVKSCFPCGPIHTLISI
jgi:hypothetical protein